MKIEADPKGAVPSPKPSLSPLDNVAFPSLRPTLTVVIPFSPKKARSRQKADAAMQPGRCGRCSESKPTTT